MRYDCVYFRARRLFGVSLNALLRCVTGADGLDFVCLRVHALALRLVHIMLA